MSNNELRAQTDAVLAELRHGTCDISFHLQATTKAGIPVSILQVGKLSTPGQDHTVGKRQRLNEVLSNTRTTSPASPPVSL